MQQIHSSWKVNVTTIATEISFKLNDTMTPKTWANKKNLFHKPVYTDTHTIPSQKTKNPGLHNVFSSPACL